MKKLIAYWLVDWCYLACQINGWPLEKLVSKKHIYYGSKTPLYNAGKWIRRGSTWKWRK